MYGRFRSTFSKPRTVTLMPKVHNKHFDHVHGHQRKKFPFLSNGIETKANKESNNETGNRKINFAIVKINTDPFHRQYLSTHLLLSDAGDNLILEMVQGTRIPWKTGEENKLGLSGLNDLYRFAPWT